MELNYIVSDPDIMMGKPLPVKGTRITVEIILEKLSCGESVEQIIESFPQLSREAIQGALAFAAKALKSDIVYPVKGDVA